MQINNLTHLKRATQLMGSTMAVKARFVKRTNRIRMTVGLFLLSLLLRKVQRVWDVKTVPKTTDCFSEQNYSQGKGVNWNIKLCSYIWEVVTCYDPGHHAPDLRVVTGNHRPRTSCSLPWQLLLLSHLLWQTFIAECPHSRHKTLSLSYQQLLSAHTPAAYLWLVSLLKCWPLIGQNYEGSGCHQSSDRQR